MKASAMTAPLMPVGGTSTYFDNDSIVDGSAPDVVNSSGFFNATVAANHKEGAEELALLKYVYARPDLDRIRGSPDAVCDAIDDFAATIPRGLMTIGAEKRAFITGLLDAAESAPKLFLEFGSYVGYSAICLAGAMVKRSGKEQVRYVSFEKNPIIAAVAASLADLAGLRDVVTIHVGAAGDSLERLVHEGIFTKGAVDFMLLDHWKDLYIPDLQVCEAHSLLKPGSVVLADNIIFPGAPEYLAYVKAGKAEASPDGYNYATKTADFILPFGGPVRTPPEQCWKYTLTKVRINLPYQPWYECCDQTGMSILSGFFFEHGGRFLSKPMLGGIVVFVNGPNTYLSFYELVQTIL